MLKDIFLKCKELALSFIINSDIEDEIIFAKRIYPYTTFSCNYEYIIEGNTKGLILAFSCNVPLSHLENITYRVGYIFFFYGYSDLKDYYFRAEGTRGIELVSAISPPLFNLLIKNINIVSEDKLDYKGIRASFAISGEDFYNYILPHIKYLN